MLEACRTCLRLIDVDSLPFYEIEADDVQLSTDSCRHKLLRLIPEIALNITPKSMICAECHGSLEAMFEFKAKCLKTENIITQYLQAKLDVDIKKLDLKDVSAFHMSHSGDTEITKDEVVEMSVEFSTVKQELESTDGDEDFAVVDESITVVKHEVDDCLSESVVVVQPVNTVLGSKVESGFICQVCSKRCSSSGALKRHTYSHYNQPYKCTFCLKVFKYKSGLNRHATIHTESYECEMCGKKLSSSASLTYHTMIHKGMRKYACDRCDKRFVTGHELKSHLRTHTGEKPHSCELCDQRFRHKRNLTIHLRKHTGEQPYVCAVCGKAFYSNKTLKAHERIHSNERTCVCPVCPKSFYTNANLKEHVRTHTGEKPYQCEKCKTRFTTRGNLCAHRKKHCGFL